MKDHTIIEEVQDQILILAPDHMLTKGTDFLMSVNAPNTDGVDGDLYPGRMRHSAVIMTDGAGARCLRIAKSNA